MESFAFPDNIRMSKSFIPFHHQDSISLWDMAFSIAVLLLDCYKKPFLSPVTWRQPKGVQLDI